MICTFFLGLLVATSELCVPGAPPLALASRTSTGGRMGWGPPSGLQCLTHHGSLVN
jgi:hypothetical protein